MSRAPIPSKLQAGLGFPGAPEVASRSAARSIRSLGWELHCLRKAGRLLAARVRNGTLPGPLIEFLTPLLAASAMADRNIPVFNSPLRLAVLANEVRVSWAALDEAGVSAVLLALLHLPALRGFWERALRRSHFNRLRRVLPRAWLVTADPPPVGAVVPGLGITAWDRLANDGTFLRLPFSAGEIVIEDAKAADAIPLVAHYEQADGRVNLRAAA